MKKSSVIALLIFLLFTLSVSFAQNTGEIEEHNEIVVTVNKEKVSVKSLVYLNEIYLLADDLGEVYRFYVHPGPGDAVFLNDVMIRKTYIYYGDIYVNAEEFAEKFHFQFETDNHSFVNFTALGLNDLYPKAPYPIEMRIMSVNRIDEATPNKVTYEIEIYFTNISSIQADFPNNSLFMEDINEKYYMVKHVKALKNITLEPGESDISGKIYFFTPYDTQMRRIILIKDDKIIGSATF